MARCFEVILVVGTITSLIKKLTRVITIAKAKIGFEILEILIPQALSTVISEFRLSLFIVITVAKRVEIGIVITNTCGRFRIIIISAMLKGMP